MNEDNQGMERRRGRAVYLKDGSWCEVLYEYGRRAVCLVRFDDGVEDVVNTSDLEMMG